jgi:hypothetical protein
LCGFVGEGETPGKRNVEYPTIPSLERNNVNYVVGKGLRLEMRLRSGFLRGKKNKLLWIWKKFQINKFE